MLSGCSGASFKLRYFARAMSRHSEARLRAAIRIVKLLLIRRKSKSSTAHTHCHTHTQRQAHTATISCDAKAKAPLAEDDITRRQDPTLSPALTLTITLQLLLTYSLSLSLSLTHSHSPAACLFVCLSIAGFVALSTLHSPFSAQFRPVYVFASSLLAPRSNWYLYLSLSL